jgi:hypothetical protein
VVEVDELEAFQLPPHSWRAARSQVLHGVPVKEEIAPLLRTVVTDGDRIKTMRHGRALRHPPSPSSV